MEDSEQGSRSKRQPSNTEAVDFVQGRIKDIQPVWPGPDGDINQDPNTGQSKPNRRWFETSAPSRRGYGWQVVLDNVFYGRNDDSSYEICVESLLILICHFRQNEQETGPPLDVNVWVSFDGADTDMLIQGVGMCLGSSTPGAWKFSDQGLTDTWGRTLEGSVLSDISESRSVNVCAGAVDLGTPLRLAILCSHSNSQRRVSLDLKLNATVEHPPNSPGKPSNTVRLDGKKSVSVDLSPQGGNRRCPLSWAAEVGWTGFCQTILKRKGILLNAKDNDGRTPLLWAARFGHTEILSILLRHLNDVDLRCKDNEGRTPLSWAAGNGYHEACKLLMHSYPQPDTEDRDYRRRTPLSWAAEEGRVDVVRTLLQNRSSRSEEIQSPTYYLDDVDAMDLFGESPIIKAAKKNHEEILKLLVHHRLRRPQPGASQRDPPSLTWASRHLYQAAEMGWTGLVKALVNEMPGLVNRELTSQDRHQASASQTTSIRTPLCIAAERGRLAVVDLLVKSGASINFETPEGRDTPLLFALRGGWEDVAKRLIESGANTLVINAGNEDARSLATRMNLSSIHVLLDKNDEDGPFLANFEPENLTTDHLFSATIMEFDYDEINPRTTAKEIPIASLLADGRQRGPTTDFQWFHLPANNMRWVEVLVSKLYSNPAHVYKVLHPSRWVRRQHYGDQDVHQARYMRPLFQAFHGPYSDDAGEKCDTDMVLFMPYLHWDLQERHEKRAEIMKLGTNRTRRLWHPNIKQERDAWLLQSYLSDCHPRHRLHPRRSLDQYYHHTLDTSQRDRDQVVSRFQQARHIKPEVQVLTVVDQLWLWVLIGEHGRADTVISCFPQAEALREPDPDGLTDVLRHVKLHLLTDPFSVKTAYDLAAVIASKCSSAYLDIGSLEMQLRFADVYETTIGEVLLRESELFQNFTSVNKASEKHAAFTIEVQQRLKDIRDRSGSLPVSVFSTTTIAAAIQTVNNFRAESYSKDISRASDLFERRSPKDPPTEDEIQEVLLEIARVQALDISEEISLLREIKDVQDELGIMQMLFEDQRRVLAGMESTITPLTKIWTDAAAFSLPAPVGPSQTPEYRPNPVVPVANDYHQADPRDTTSEPSSPAHEESLEVPDWTDLEVVSETPQTHTNASLEGVRAGIQQQHDFESNFNEVMENIRVSTARLDEHQRETAVMLKSFSGFLETHIRENQQGEARQGNRRANSWLNRVSQPGYSSQSHSSRAPVGWQTVPGIHQPQFNQPPPQQPFATPIDFSYQAPYQAQFPHQSHFTNLSVTHQDLAASNRASVSSLPLRVVSNSINDIARMSERAAKAYKALNFLVDLKQKQSNVMDARSARVQTEESLKITQETKRQGKTITVFTIVTIVFLPMSFMAAFFAINIAEFPQDSDGKLGLGFVSEVMFPVSAAITAALIYVAFKVESIEELWSEATDALGVWFHRLCGRTKS